MLFAPRLAKPEQAACARCVARHPVIGEKMALGLDFFLAGDIIQTIVVPSKETLMVLGGIVVIRTVMAYFLAKEIEKSAASE